MWLVMNGLTGKAKFLTAGSSPPSQCSGQCGEGGSGGGGAVHVLDLAAGSGEATQALEAWWASPPPLPLKRGTRRGAPGPHGQGAPDPSSFGAAGGPEEGVLPLRADFRPSISGLSLRVEASDPYTHKV